MGGRASVLVEIIICLVGLCAKAFVSRAFS
jgi:hypothetical protein